MCPRSSSCSFNVSHGKTSQKNIPLAWIAGLSGILHPPPCMDIKLNAQAHIEIRARTGTIVKIKEEGGVCSACVACCHSGPRFSAKKLFMCTDNRSENKHVTFWGGGEDGCLLEIFTTNPKRYPSSFDQPHSDP